MDYVIWAQGMLGGRVMYRCLLLRNSCVKGSAHRETKGFSFCECLLVSLSSVWSFL